MAQALAEWERRKEHQERFKPEIRLKQGWLCKCDNCCMNRRLDKIRRQKSRHSAEFKRLAL